MAKDLAAIRHYVRALVARERRLIGARVGLQLGLLALAIVLIATLAAVFRWDRSLVAGVLVTVGGVGLWAAVFAPLLTAWRRSADLMRQARLVEGLEPTLQGRLLTTVERLDGPIGQESGEILGLIARRALQRLARLPAHKVHRSWRLYIGAAAVCVAFVATLTTSLFAPGGPLGALQFWIIGDAAYADVAENTNADMVDNARVGDLVLEYTFPDYTGLEPIEVPNSTGDAHGPPGTRVRVRARSADAVDAAVVMAYGQPGEDLSVEDQRLISGTFTIQKDPGEWLLELHSGESVRTSRTFQIKPDPDLVPEVIVSGPTRIEVPLDAPLGLTWQARDDYGLTRAALFIDGKEYRQLRTIDGRGDATGELTITPKQMGMSVGMSMTLQVGAWDNNAWSGVQLGLSEPAKQLIVVSAQDHSQLADNERLQLRDILVDLLAQQVMQPWPPGSTGGSIARSGEEYSSFYEPLREFIESTPGLERDRFVARLVSDLLGEGASFIGYTQVNFEPDATDPPSTDVMRQATRTRTGSIEANEFAIVLLDRYVQGKALGEMFRHTKSMARQGKRLERTLQRDADNSELLTVMGRLEHSLDQLALQLPYLSEDTTKRVVQQRSTEMQLLSGQVRQALDNPDRTDARELAGRLSRQMQELQAELEYRMRAIEGEENELGQKLEDLVKKLSRLERDQRQLQSKVHELRQSSDAEGAAEAERLWEQIEALAEEAATMGEGVVERLKRRRSMFMVQERAAYAQRNTERVVDAARARDLRKSIDDVGDALIGWSTHRRLISDSYVSPIVGRLEKAERYLRQLSRRSAETSPQVAAQTRSMRQDQLKIQTELSEAQKQATELIQEMPIEPRGMADALQLAQGAMARANIELLDGQPMPAEGAQGQAAEQVKEARERLIEAMKQMAASGTDARGGEPGNGDPKSGAGVDLESEANLGPKDIDIDDQFNLDEFQQDLLDGMQGQVPDSYRAMKRRYYEELVTQ